MSGLIEDATTNAMNTTKAALGIVFGAIEQVPRTTTATASPGLHHQHRCHPPRLLCFVPPPPRPPPPSPPRPPLASSCQASDEAADPFMVAASAIDKGQAVVENLMMGLGATANMRLPAGTNFSLQSQLEGSAAVNMSDKANVAAASCYQVATGTATLASTMLEGLPNVHDLAALQTAGLQVLVTLAEKWAPAKMALDFLAKFFPQIDALRGRIAPPGKDGVANSSRKLDLAGLFNSSGLNATQACRCDRPPPPPPPPPIAPRPPPHHHHHHRHHHRRHSCQRSNPEHASLSRMRLSSHPTSAGL